VKHVILVPATETTEALRAWADGTAATDAPVDGLVVYLAREAGPYAGVLETWAPQDAPGPETLRARWNGVRYAVEPRQEHDRLRAAAGPEAIVQIACWRRRPDLAPLQAREAWDEHVPLARQVHRGAARYVRNWVLGASPGAPDVSGVAVLTYPDARAFETGRYAAPGDQDLIAADTARFIGSCQSLTAQEIAVRPPPPRAVRGWTIRAERRQRS
jgi:hypothetical protein